MQSLESAARTCVLGALVGAVLTVGCGRPNPGFKLKDTGDSQGDSSSQGSVAETTDTAPPPTTSTTVTTTGESMTTAGPAVSGSDSGTTTTTTMGDPTTTTADDTTTGTTAVVEPCDQNQPKTLKVEPAADGFFFNSYAQNSCAFNEMPLSDTNNCVDLNAGKSPNLPLVYDNIGDPDVSKHVISLFAVRFPAVPADITIFDATLELHFVRTLGTGEWGPPKLDIYPMTTAGWEEGDNDQPEGCPKGSASFRCLTCGATPEAVACPVWPGSSTLYPAKGAALFPTFSLGAAKPEVGADVIHTQILDDESLAVATGPGLMVVPLHRVIWNDRIEVRSRESAEGKRPLLILHYCPN